MDNISVLNDRRFDTIVKTVDLSDRISRQIEEVENISASINETLFANLIETATELESILNDVNLRKDNYDKLISHRSSLDEILRLTTILDEHLDDPDHYEKAVDSLARIEDLYKNYGHDIDLIKIINRDGELQREFLIAMLCDKLESSRTKDEANVKRLVNCLIKCGNFSDRDLRLKYLNARDNWFTSACEDNSSSFDNVVSVYSNGLPMIFNEYKNIFGDQVEQYDAGHKVLSSTDPVREGGAIINSWLLLKTSVFIASLEVYLKEMNQSVGSTPSMFGDTIEKCFKLTKWLATIGFDFSHQLKPLFSKAIMDEMRQSIEKATSKFESCFGTTVSKSIESLLLPVDDEILRISNINPFGKGLPKSIEHYPIFKIYCSHLVDSLRWLQATKDTISPISLCYETYSALNVSLTRVTKALSIILAMDNNSHHPILTKIAISLITEVLPYLTSNCEELFPEKVVLSAIGLSKSDFKAIYASEPEKLSNFRLNLKQIAEPLRGSMNALVQTIEE